MKTFYTDAKQSGWNQCGELTTFSKSHKWLHEATDQFTRRGVLLSGGIIFAAAITV